MKEIKIIRAVEYNNYDMQRLEEQGWRVVQAVPVRKEYIEYEYILEREKP